MLMIEADAKQILRRAGLPVPSNAVLLQDGDPATVTRPSVLKAQLLQGGRGKAGLVRVVGPDDAAFVLTTMRQALTERQAPSLVLVEDQVAFQQEYYLGWRIDDLRHQPVLMFSMKGGIEIESRADSVQQLWVDPTRLLHPQDLVSFLRAAGLSGRSLASTSRFASDLYRVFRSQDADLIEINPLAVTAEGSVIALDCKMSVDSAACARHIEWQALASYGLRHAGMTRLEAQAEDAGLTFVELSGNVALLSGGAGLGMALLDLLAESGFKAANFCDTVGGSGMAAFTKLTELVFERADDPAVEVIAAFFTLSATSLKSAVVSLLETIERKPPAKPLVVGFAATGAAEREMSVEQAVAAFAAAGYECVTTPVELMLAVEKHATKRMVD